MNGRRIALNLFITGLLFGGQKNAFCVSSPEQPPSDVLKRVDEIRNPASDFLMKVAVSANGSQDETKVFEVSTSGSEHTLIKTLEPPRDRKRDLLMVQQSMWAYIPNLSRSVRVSLSQKLNGDAANGDISRMRWADDYSFTLESQSPEQWVLLLVAKKEGLTYEKIRAFIDKKNFRPVKAEYLSKDLLVLKNARFYDYKTLAGSLRPSKIEIEDAVRKDKKTLIEILDLQERKFAAAQFSPERFGVQ